MKVKWTLILSAVVVFFAVLITRPWLFFRLFILLVAAVFGAIYWGYERHVRILSSSSRRSSSVEQETRSRTKKRPSSSSSEIPYELSGNLQTDAALHKLIDVIEEIYLSTWFNNLSDNDQVPRKIRHIICFMIKKLCMQLQKVDIQKLLFEESGAAVADHCRIWRMVKSKQDIYGENDDSSIFSVFSAKSTESDRLERSTIEQFFEEELHLIGKSYEKIVTDKNQERLMAKSVAEVILYLVLPEDELKSRAVVLLVTEILVNGVILPLVETVSSPDYINQMVCWFLENAAKDTEDATVNLIHAAKESRSLGELEGILEAMESECAQLRSNDTCGTESIEHQELILLEELLKIVTESCKKIKKGGRFVTNENSETKTDNLYDLSIDVALENKLALDKFREYLKSMQLEQYLLFWLHVENFRTSADKLKNDRPRTNSISSARFTGIFRSKTQYHIQSDTLRTIACSIYDEYLHSSARKRLDLDEALVNKLKHELSQDNSPIKSSLFDDLQQKCLHVLTSDVMMYPGFRKSELYVELLSDLDLDGLSSEDPMLREETTRISAQIIDINISKESGSAHAAFQISVTRLAGTDDSESYSILRRFSDFHDLDLRLREMLQDADFKKMNLQLPSKTLFRELETKFLEDRMLSLDNYLQRFVASAHTNRYLFPILEEFLVNDVYLNKKKQIQKRMDSLVSPLKNASKVMADAPGNIFASLKTSAEQVKQKMTPSGMTSSASSSSRDDSQEEKWLLCFRNILDEIFDLGARGKWFRRQFMQLFTAALETNFFAGKMNVKIREFIEDYTEDSAVAGYIEKVKVALFPQDRPAKARSRRSSSDIVITGFLARIRLLTAFPESLRHMLGNETCRGGIARFWQLIQHQELNKRIIWNLIEVILESTFPANTVKKAFDRTKISMEKRFSQSL